MTTSTHSHKAWTGKGGHVNIARPKQQAHAWLRQLFLAVDRFVAQTLQRQPEHTMTALLTLEFELACSLQPQHLELIDATGADLRLERQRTWQQAAAVVAQAAGHQLLPLAEVLTAEQRAQARPLQQLPWLGRGQCTKRG